MESVSGAECEHCRMFFECGSADECRNSAIIVSILSGFILFVLTIAFYKSYYKVGEAIKISFPQINENFSPQKQNCDNNPEI
jgi:hypothetical protein